MMTAELSVDVVERAFGDPWDHGQPGRLRRPCSKPTNARRCRPRAKRCLTQSGSTPSSCRSAWGGRFTRMDRLVRVMRAVFRRDPCLGLGYGASSFIAAVNVWAAGDAAQQRRPSPTCCWAAEARGGLPRARPRQRLRPREFAAARTGTGWRAERPQGGHRQPAPGLGACAVRPDQPRTGQPQPLAVPRAQDRDRRGHDALSAAFPQFRHARRAARRCRVPDCDVPADCLLGRRARASRPPCAPSSSPAARSPRCWLGFLDTGLRAAAGCARDRRLYGGTAADLPQVRAVLADAFADLLIVDSFWHGAAPGAARAARADAGLRLRGQVPGVGVADATRWTRSPRCSARSSTCGTARTRSFGKQARDLPPAGFGHAARAACLVTILPQLPRLARRAWLTGEPRRPRSSVSAPAWRRSTSGASWPAATGPTAWRARCWPSTSC